MRQNVVVNYFFFGTGSLTNLLQKAAVNIIDEADCQQSYGNVLTPSMMCAGYMEGGRDTCLVRCSKTFCHETKDILGPFSWYKDPPFLLYLHCKKLDTTLVLPL